jgi:hypothetical protein
VEHSLKFPNICSLDKIFVSELPKDFNFKYLKKIILEAQWQTQPDKPLAYPIQAHWQRGGRSFTCTPLDLNQRPFLRSQGPTMGLKHFLPILYDIGFQLPVSSTTHVQNMLIVEYPSPPCSGGSC